MNDIKKSKSNNRISFITALIAIVCTYGLFFNNSWAVDHIGNYYGLGKWAWSIKGYVTVTLAGGRFGAFIWDTVSFLFAQIGVTKLTNEWVLQAIFMVCLACATSILFTVFEKYFEIKYKPIILTLIICIAFINPLFVENFVFVGYELGVSTLCSAYAVKLFSEKSITSSVFAVLLLFISVITYQAHISLFLIWTTAYIYLEYGRRITKTAIVELIRSYAITLIPLVVDLVVMKIFASYSQRGDDLATGESVSLIKSIIRVWYHLYVTEIDLTTRCFVLVFVAICVLIAVISFVRAKVCEQSSEQSGEQSYKQGCDQGTKQVQRKNAGEIVYLIAVFMVLNCYYVAIVLVGYTSFYGRIFWPGFAAISMMIMLCLNLCLQDCQNNCLKTCSNLSVDKSAFEKTSRVFLIVLSMFFLGLFFFTQTESTDCYLANKLDEEIAGIVEEQIEHYEVETGNTVTTIKARVLENSDRYEKYLLRNSEYEFAYKMMSLDTLPIDLINYVYDEEYAKQRMTDEELEVCFSLTSTDISLENSLVGMEEFNPSKQLVFEEDVVYWLVY